VAVDREAGAGQRRRAQRAFVHPFACIGEAAEVAGEHLDIGHHVMAEGDRLRRLQMGEARHHPVGRRLGAGQQRADQRIKPLDRGVRLIAHPQAEVGRDLIVAAPRRVQTPGRLADDLFQPRLDVHVNVFERGRERELAGLDL